MDPLCLYDISMPLLSFAGVPMTSWSSSFSLTFTVISCIASYVYASLLPLQRMRANMHPFLPGMAAYLAAPKDPSCSVRKMAPLVQPQSTSMFPSVSCIHFLSSIRVARSTTFRTISLTFEKFLLCVCYPVGILRVSQVPVRYHIFSSHSRIV